MNEERIIGIFIGAMVFVGGALYGATTSDMYRLDQCRAQHDVECKLVAVPKGVER